MAENSVFNFTTSIQEKILALLWTDTTYIELYSECIRPKYFQKAIHIDLCRILLNYYEKYGEAPTKDAFVQEVYTMCEKNRSKAKLQEEYLDCIDRLVKYDYNDYDFLKDKIIEFGKKQAMIEAIMESADIIESNGSESYHQVSDIIQKAQMVGENAKDLGINYWDNFEERIHSYTNAEDVIERIPTGMGKVDEILNGGIGKTELCVVLAPPGRGKALHPDTPVLTPDGYKPIKEISIDDYVISVDGSKTKVNGVFHHDKKHMYKVKLLDGSEVICCDEHLWNVQTRDDRANHKTEYRTMQLKDMLKNIKAENGTRCNYSLPVMTAPCELNPRGEITLEPWLVGAFIGDGCSKNNFTFNNTEDDVIKKFNKLLPKGSKLKNVNSDIVEHDIVMSDGSKRGRYEKNLLRIELEKLGLWDKYSYEKEIPEAYLFSTPKNRLELLQGLLDTDGWVKSQTSIVYSTTSKVLSEQVKFLSESLGMFASLSNRIGRYSKRDKDGNKIYKDTRTQYEVLIRPLNGLVPVSSKKHLSKLKIKPEERRFIESAEYIGDSEAICISVEHESKLYVIKDGIVTHNTTTLINMGANALRNGYTVFHFSLENNEKQVTRNYDLRLLNHNFEYLQEESIKCAEALGRIKKYSNGGQLFIKKYPTKGVTVDTLKMYINHIERIYGVKADLVIVDYGAILKSKSNYGDKRNNIESNYEDLKALADELNVAVATGAQGNRSSLSKRVVTMEDLAEAFAIANISDVMFALCQTLREKKENKMRAFFTKVRDGKDSILLMGEIQYETKRMFFNEDITESLVNEDGEGDDDEDDDDNGGYKSKKRYKRKRNKPMTEEEEYENS